MEITQGQDNHAQQGEECSRYLVPGNPLPVHEEHEKGHGQWHQGHDERGIGAGRHAGADDPGDEVDPEDETGKDGRPEKLLQLAPVMLPVVPDEKR